MQAAGPSQPTAGPALRTPGVSRQVDAAKFADIKKQFESKPWLGSPAPRHSAFKSHRSLVTNSDPKDLLLCDDSGLAAPRLAAPRR